MRTRTSVSFGAAAMALLAGTAVLSSSAAEAAIQCRGRAAGEGTGMGIAGQGSAAARANAMDDWSRKVVARYGAAFGNASLARGVRYDCRQGAILQAKCVVSAVPCGDVPRKPAAKTKKKKVRR